MRKIQLCLCCLLTILISNGCSSKKDTVTLEKYSMTSTSLGFDTVVMFTAYDFVIHDWGEVVTR